MSACSSACVRIAVYALLMLSSAAQPVSSMHAPPMSTKSPSVATVATVWYGEHQAVDTHKADKESVHPCAQCVAVIQVEPPA